MENELISRRVRPKDAYRQKTINMELAKLTGIKGVPVPPRPAPPQSPGRTKKARAGGGVVEVGAGFPLVN